MQNKKIWFKRKIYGWGWYPATVSGWVVTLIYVIAVVSLASAVAEGADKKEWWLFFVLPTMLLTISFIRIAYKYGESPRWQWGQKKGDKDTNI